jgi:hypothetical protein
MHNAVPYSMLVGSAHELGLRIVGSTVATYVPSKGIPSMPPSIPIKWLVFSNVRMPHSTDERVACWAYC